MQARNHIPLNDGQIQEAARLFATLSEPSRLRLLQALMGGPMTVTELVEATDMRQGNVSKQLGILYDARLVARNREGNFIRYAIGDEMIFQLCDLACRKIQSDALARVASLQGASNDQKSEFVKVAKEVNHERKPMLFKLSTDKSVNETAAALQAAVIANRFGVMQVHNLRETMTKKGVEFGRECLIFEVCQPQQAKKVLDENMSISTMLPCRVSLYEEGGKTILATLKPTALLAMFNVPQLEGVAQDVEKSILQIMKEAATD